MKIKKKLIAFGASILSIGAVNVLSIKNESIAQADGTWTETATKALASKTQFQTGDTYMFISLSVNDYQANTGGNLYIYTGDASYYNLSDYNFKTKVLFSNDNVNYVTLQSIEKTFEFFWSDGTFRVGLSSSPSDYENGTYEYVKIEQGCTFPSLDYCKNGGAQKRYITTEETISKIVNKPAIGAQFGVCSYTEYVESPNMTFVEVAGGWNNADYGTPGYLHTILNFGTWNVDFFSNDHNSSDINRADSSYDIGNKLTINGLPIYKIKEMYPNTSVDYAHGFAYMHILYPAEVTLPTASYPIPILHIEQDTEFVDRTVDEVTLKLVGGVWSNVKAETFQLEDPENIETVLNVPFPYKYDTNPICFALGVAEEGCRYAFTFNLGNADLTSDSCVCNFVFYSHTLSITPYNGTLVFINSSKEIARYTGFHFEKNTDYLMEIEVVTGNPTSFKIAIDHFLLIDITDPETIMNPGEFWSINPGATWSLDLPKESKQYEPSLVFGGSDYYDFNEGDEVYDFSSLASIKDLYGDNTSNEITFTYPEGAVTNGKYNPGVWTLTITGICPGYRPITKEITIIVHSKVSMAKIYYDDADPIEVEVGSKLELPATPKVPEELGPNYIFDGWMFEGFLWDFSNAVVEGDMHLYSHFVDSTPHYTLTINYEGVNRPTDTLSVLPNSSLPFDMFIEENASFEVYKDGQKITSLVIDSNDMVITVKYLVTYVHHERVEATCQTPGNVEYWTTSLYAGYYFADSEGKEVLKNIVIPQLTHSPQLVLAKEATCTQSGNVECYYCDNCHKYFSDELGQVELSDQDRIIPQLEHDVTCHNAVSPTCSEDGTIEYFTCSHEPGVYYADKDCTIVIYDITDYSTGHEFGLATYEWIETSDGYECTATLSCLKCSHSISETVTASKTVISIATCAKEGEVSFFASFENKGFNTQTKLVKLPKLAHDYQHVDEVKATEETEGLKEHYYCPECGGYFVLVNNEYVEVSYSSLVIPIISHKSGCGGSIISTCILTLSISGASLILLAFRKRKEDR